MSNSPHPEQRHSGPRCPLLFASLAYAAGILFAAHCWRPRLWWLAAVVALLAGASVIAIRTRGAGENASELWRGHAAQVCILACIAALGAIGYDARWSREPDRSGWQTLTDGEETIVTGYVVRDGLLQGSGSSRRQSVDVQLESAERIVLEAQRTDSPRNRAIGSSGDRTVRHSSHRKSAYRRPKRPTDPCEMNAAWPAELLAASGLEHCKDQVPSGAQSAVRARKSSPRKQNTEILRSAQDDETIKGKSKGNGKARDEGQQRMTLPRAEGIIRLLVYSGRSGTGQLSEKASGASESQSGDDTEPEADGADGHLPNVFTYGQRLRLRVKLRPPRNFGNPGALDYVGYLHGQGIYALGSVRADRIEVLDGTAGSRWGLWRSRIRRNVVGKVHALWGHEQAGVLDAMLIGERSSIGRDTSTAYQRTGIYHILVVSGMNVGILAFGVFWILRRLRCGDFVATILTILLSGGYAYVAESGAPIVRSVVMLAIYLCTRLLYRQRAMLNAVGAAALALMIFDPRAVTDASFQLTFLSVLAISGIAVPLIERTSQPFRTSLRWLGSTDYDMSLEPRFAQFRLDLRMVAERLAWFVPRWPRPLSGRSGRVLRLKFVQWFITFLLGAGASIYELLVVSATTQIALALPMAWYFHRATVVGLPANLIAVPLTGVLMPASVAAVALSYVSMPVARVPAWIASWSLEGITKTVNVLGGLRAADMRVATPELATAFAAAGAFALAIVLIRRRWIIATLGLAALGATAVWIATVPPKARIERGILEVTAIDVGQAESFLVVTPEGKTLLVDAAGSLGPFQSEFDFGQDVIAPYLWSRGITSLDAVAVTHAHSDHYGGMRSILSIFRPREMWVGPNAPDMGFEAVLTKAKQDGVHLLQRSGGEFFQFGGAEVRVLAPSRTWQPGPKPKNDDSMVLWFRHGGTSALLEADAERAAERQMLMQDLKSDLLKVGHNGSNTSTSQEFLEAVRPAYAVISVGARNSFGHPRPEVLERLGSMHVTTYRTDLMGAVTFLLDGKRVTPKLPLLEDR